MLVRSSPSRPCTNTFLPRFSLSTLKNRTKRSSFGNGQCHGIATYRIPWRRTSFPSLLVRLPRVSTPISTPIFTSVPNPLWFGCPHRKSLGVPSPHFHIPLPFLFPPKTHPKPPPT